MRKLYRRRRRRRRIQTVPKENTSLEKSVQAILDAAHISYVQQFSVGKYRTDFYVPGLRLVLEADGCYWHRCAACGYTITPRKQAYAQRRDAVIRDAGYRITHLLEHDLRRAPFDTVMRALEQSISGGDEDGRDSSTLDQEDSHRHCDGPSA